MPDSYDPHALLGVGLGASKDEIEKAWLRKAKHVHPDVSSAPDATEQFKRLTDARDLLIRRLEQVLPTPPRPADRYTPSQPVDEDEQERIIQHTRRMRRAEQRHRSRQQANVGRKARRAERAGEQARRERQRRDEREAQEYREAARRNRERLERERQERQAREAEREREQEARAREERERRRRLEREQAERRRQERERAKQAEQARAAEEQARREAEAQRREAEAQRRERERLERLRAEEAAEAKLREQSRPRWAQRTDPPKPEPRRRTPAPAVRHDTASARSTRDASRCAWKGCDVSQQLSEPVQTVLGLRRFCAEHRQAYLQRNADRASKRASASRSRR